MSTHGPDPRAAARGFIALALDMARVDPERRPSADLRRWLVDLAEAVGADAPAMPRTYRELVEVALRLEEWAHAHSDKGTAPPERVLVGVTE